MVQKRSTIYETSGIVAILLCSAILYPVGFFQADDIAQPSSLSGYVSIAAGADHTAGYVYVLRSDGTVYFTPRGTCNFTLYGSSMPSGTFVALAAGAGKTTGYLYVLRDNGEVYYTERGMRGYLRYTQSSLPADTYVGLASRCEGTSGYVYVTTNGGSVYFASRGSATWQLYSQAQPPAGTYVGITAGSSTTGGYIYLLTKDGFVYFTDRGTGSWHAYTSPPTGGGEFVSIAAGSGTTAGYLYILTKDGKVYFTDRGTRAWTLYTQALLPAGTYVSIAAGSGTTAGYVYVLKSTGEIYFTARGAGNWYRYGAGGLPTLNLDHVTTVPRSFITYLGANPTQIIAKAWADAAETTELTTGLSYSWSVTPSELGRLDSTSTKVVSFTPLKAGVGKLLVSVSYGSTTKQGFCDVTISSTPPTLDSVTVTPDSASLTVNEQIEFVARGWNGTQELSGVAFEWSISPPYLGSINTTTGPVVRFTAQSVAVGKLIVTGTYLGRTRQATAVINVSLAPSFHHVTVVPDAIICITNEQYGEIEAKAWADSAETQELTTGVSYAWSVSPANLGSLNVYNKKIVLFTAGAENRTGKLVVNVSYSGLVKQGICNVKVVTTPPKLDRVSILPPKAVVSIGASQLFQAFGWNESYVLSGVAFHWRISPSYLGKLSATAGSVVTFTAGSTAARGKIFVNGTYGGETKSAEASIVVTATILKTVFISPQAATIQLGKSQYFKAEARDQTDAPLTGVRYSWRLIPWDLGVLSSTTGENVTVTPAKVCTGKLNVTASYGGVTLHAEATITVVALGTLSGYVTSETGRRIASATVKFQLGTLTKKVTTGSNGKYIVELPVGTYNVTVSAEGYETLKVQLTIYPGNNTKNFTLRTKVSEGEFPAGAVVLIIIIVVVSVVLAIFLWNRKKKQQKTDEKLKQRQPPRMGVQYSQPAPPLPPQRQG